MRRAIGTQGTRAVAAFTLIEILIAMFILAFGLLGLVAVFAVVTREQQIAVDRAQGISGGNSMTAMLSALDTNSAINGAPNDFIAWQALRDDEEQGLGDPDNFGSGQWFVPRSNHATPGFTRVGLPDSNEGFDLSPISRLYPADAGAPPAYVWDIALHRVPPDPKNPSVSSASDALRAAVFIRRIDPRIRVPEGLTVNQALLSGTGQNGRVAVAVDEDGIPTLDGRGLYAEPVVARHDQHANSDARVFEFRDLQENPINRRTLFNIDTEQPEGRALYQRGQLLVDNLGQVFRVVELIEDNGEFAVRLDRDIPAEAIRPSGNELGDEAEDWYEFVLTPQVPVEVRLVEVHGAD